MSPDGRAIAIANVDNNVRIWRVGRPTPQILKGHQAEVWEFAFSPDRRLVASASNDGTVKLWTLEGTIDLEGEWVGDNQCGTGNCRGHKHRAKWLVNRLLILDRRV